MWILSQVVFIFFSFAALGVNAMISKRASYMEKHFDEIPSSKRFRSNVADLFLTNEISGCRARQLYEDHVAADKNSVKDLLRSGSFGTCNGNVSRDLLRKLKKRTAWPPLYWAKITVFDLKKQTSTKKWMPFLLPHELLGSLIEHARDTAALYQHSGLCKQSLDHLNHCANKLGLSSSQLVAAGIWGDGVPMNFDRTQSLEVFSLALPGLVGDVWRFPIVVVPKKYECKQTTKDDIMAVISWSFQQLAAGRYPISRHDGLQWQVTDAWRKKKNLQPLPRAVLVEVKGDWAFMKDTFRFPQHNELLGCCWLCSVRPSGIRDATSTAPWRAARLSHWQLLARIRSQGLSVSPIFGIPFLTTAQFMVDWLHVADQGISAVFLASLFLYILPKLQGNTEAQKVSSLFVAMTKYYNDNNIDSRLDNLTIHMLGKKHKPKLRAKACEVRSLIDFAFLLAHTHLDPNDVVDQSVQAATACLQQCYANLSHDTYNKLNLAGACKSFCILICELEKRLPFFKVIPKMHLFQELCEMSALTRL